MGSLAVKNKENDDKMKTIIERGLIGLASAGTINGGNWFVGHFGAEVLSLAFLLFNKRTEQPVELLIFDRLDDIFKTHAVFFETPLSTVNISRGGSVNDFVKKVESSISDLYVDGHHTIYSALALRAFSLYPELARPEIIQGLIGLLNACTSAGFDRYYGLKPQAFNNKKLLENFHCHSALKAAEVALEQHSEVITDRKAEGDFYFFSGSRLHLLTHAQALLDLEKMGYGSLVKSGLPTFTKHCICINASRVPEGAQPYKIKRSVDPRNINFWQRAKTNPHHAKIAYAVLEIFAALPQENQTKALKDLSVYWEFYE